LLYEKLHRSTSAISGTKCFTAGKRPIPTKPNKGNFDMNIWMMSKTESGWSKPTPLPEPINYVQIEKEEWPSSNNNFLFQMTTKHSISQP
jgi:hypothetical protein